LILIGKKQEEVPFLPWFGINFALGILPLLFALFYPEVGKVLGYIGSISGFLAIYTIPTVTHLKRMKTQIEDPLLAEALDKKEVTIEFTRIEGEGVSKVESPMFSVKDSLIQQSLDDPKKAERL